MHGMAWEPSWPQSLGVAGFESHSGLIFKLNHDEKIGGHKMGSGRSLRTSITWMAGANPAGKNTSTSGRKAPENRGASADLFAPRHAGDAEFRALPNGVRRSRRRRARTR